jgi:hypothetical protein
VIARLDDPWFEAKFVTESSVAGHRFHSSIDGADGVFLWCPCGYGKPAYPLDGGRPHAILVHFRNPRGCAPAPPDTGMRNKNGGPPPRWAMSGTGLHDLTLHPSVDIGEPSCWHGWIQNGVVS